MNLTFLNPAFLWLVPASLFPVILHLLFRRKPRHTPFSDMRLVRLAMKNVLPKTKLHRWLLLLLRCLVLFLLIMLAARPVGYYGSPEGKNRAHQVTLLIDTSYSMQYTESGITRFNKTQEYTGRLIDELLSRSDSRQTTGRQQVNIVAFSDYIETAMADFSSDRDYLHEFMGDISAGYRTTDLLTGLSFCYKNLTGMPEGNRTVIVVSDMCRHMLPSLTKKTEIESLISEYDPSVRLAFVSVHNSESGNTGIENVKIMDNPLSFLTEVRNFSQPRKVWDISLNIAGTNVAHDFLSLQEQKSETYEFRYTAETGGVLDGYVSLQKDNLTADDRYYFAHTPRRSIQVLIVDGDPRFGNTIDSESYYVATALSGRNVHQDSDRFSVTVVNDKELPYLDTHAYDVVILCNTPALPEDTFTAMKGKNLIVSLGDNYMPESYPRELRSRIGRIEEGKFGISSISEQPGLVSNIDDFELGNIIFNKKYALSGGDVLMQLDDNSALLSEYVSEDRCLLLFGSSFDRDWTNFPSKPFYPYFIRLLVEYCAGQERESDPVAFLTVGDTIKHTFSGRRENVSITLPDGSSSMLKSGPLGSVYQVVYGEAEVPGVYTLHSGAESIRIAVNLNTERDESDVRALTASELKDFFRDSPVWVVDAAKTSQNDLIALLEGKELTGTILLAVLLLLGIELLVAYSKI